MRKNEISIHWFRQDLRLNDNPALRACAVNGTVLPVFIFDDKSVDKHNIGRASQVWLYHSLKSLNTQLDGTLRCFRGNPKEILEKIAIETDAKTVTWNRMYEPHCIARDKNLKLRLSKLGIHVQSYNGALLWEPWETLKNDGTPYKVFTPFYRRGCLNAAPPHVPEPAPKIDLLPNDRDFISQLNTLELLSERPWETSIVKEWDIGERGANNRLLEFMNDGIIGYKDGRNFPIKNNVSRLSPHLHWGEISANTIWHTAKKTLENNDSLDNDVSHFLSELGWREFSNSLLYHFPKLPTDNLQTRFNSFPWRNDKTLLKAWQQGLTGYPIVDAGMRQLWQTGYMHNRLRMIVGSFLVKNLLLHWHEGEAWFWDCLVDADLASNSASWQWIAGCGADAAPYFRIFNPVLQGLKFDSTGEFVRQFIPELAELPNKYLFTPWEAPEKILSDAGIQLGKTYPKPIVNLKESRERALAAFSNLKKVN